VVKVQGEGIEVIGEKDGIGGERADMAHIARKGIESVGGGEESLGAIVEMKVKVIPEDWDSGGVELTAGESELGEVVQGEECAEVDDEFWNAEDQSAG
jgi:hypothetical protein